MADNVIRRDVVQVEFESDALDELKKLSKEFDDLKRKLMGGVGDEEMEDLGDETKRTKKEIDNTNKSAGKLKSTLKSIGKITFKAMAVGLGAAATATGILVKQSVAAYAEFEQLKGGVDTLFGSDNDTVIKNANNAWKTAGLSANAYMDTVTSFSASLIQSLGGDTKKAAALADTALIDMSDNANKMGTDMGMIQNAYQGFAKQNYTMLDNLKLGYGGTKTEMERLVKEASQMKSVQKELGITVDGTSMSFDNIVKAIHVVQENMKINGTTSKEAMRTITGSISSFKAAWQNMLPALIQGGDQFDQCLDNLIDSIIGVKNESGKLEGGLVRNLVPAIQKSLGGIGTLIEELSPMIAEGFPKLVDMLLPPLLDAAVQLFKAFIVALPNIVNVVIKEIPNILKELGQAIGEAFGIDTSGLDRIGDFFAKNSETIKKAIPIIAGLAGAFMLFSKVKSIGGGIASLFGKSGGGASGGGLFSGIAALGNINTTLILKGMGNIAIVLGGFTILGAAFAAVAPHIAKLADGKELLEVAGIVAILGIVGGILAKFAGIVGMIPIPVVLTGLANMALVLGGFTAIAAAFGALTKISGFTALIDSGGEVLVKLCDILGRMAGSLIGGALANMSNSLPEIGANIAGFAENLKPMFTMFEGVDMAGAGQFFSALGGFLLKLSGENALSFFTGGPDFEAVAKGLASLATDGVKKFFAMVSAIEETAFSKAGQFFTALDGISKLPNVGGLGQLFSGENDFTGVATGLGALAGEGTKNFFAMVAGMEEKAFTNAKSFFTALDGISALPNIGGLGQLFSGKNDFAGVASGLATLSGEGVKGFFAMVAGIDETTFAKTATFFATLTNLGDIGKTGFGKKSSLSSLAQGLSDLSTKATTFFEQINALNVENLTGLATGLNNVGSATTTLQQTVSSEFDAIVTAIKTGSLAAVQTVTMMKNQIITIVSATNLAPSGAQMMNSLLAGINSRKSSVLSTISSIAAEIKSKINSVTAAASKLNATGYATGTNGHRGGNAIVNDGRGAELVQMPNGNTFIPNGRNVFLPNAPQGMKVLDAQRTAKLFGKPSPTFRYASGTGERSIGLPQYVPSSSVSSSSSTENNTYAPTFNLTISGSSSDREMERKVKRWINEAMGETFRSMARRNPRLQEC